MRPLYLVAIAKFVARMIVLRMIALLAVPAALNFFVLHSVFAKDEPKWIEVHTSHFSVLSDAGEKRGREVALRMEQMRTVFGQVLLKNKLKMPVPITVIALKSDKQYGLVAPAKQSMAAGFRSEEHTSELQSLRHL